jgi:LysR family glycine cleavage system transcriptional activator
VPDHVGLTTPRRSIVGPRGGVTPAIDSRFACKPVTPPRSRRLPLTGLRIFEAAARLESFKDAADELGVSATTVSNSIRALERQWGSALFVRMTRQVVLTEFGQSLARVVRQSFDAIAQEVEHHVASRRVAVSMAVGSIFGARWLMPRLSRLRRALPHLDLTLRRGRRVTSPNDMPAAVVVDWGVGDWPGLEAEPLMRIDYAPVVAPSLLAQGGALRTPRDLARLTALHQQDRSEWRAWLDRAGVGDLTFAEEMIIEDSNVATQAALLGQGVALGIFPFVQEDVDAGRLTCPFDCRLAPAKSYHLLTRPGARQRPEIAAVCEWLRREAQAYAVQWPGTRP